MIPFIVSPIWLLILIFVIAFIATASARRLRMLERRRYEVRVCRQCGSNQPAHAAFCRQCGTRLDQ
jgi:ribosomal protein L40E